jgi:uncharacterized protein YndB with AHSA1/START domain
MAVAVEAPVSIEVVAEIDIDASPDDVWKSLTEDIGAWWPHSFSEHPFRIALEPRIGGCFFEQFDESGAGALYALVTYIDPGKTLTISGSMGMPGARQYVKKYTLEGAGGGTRVRTTASTLGDIPEEMRESYRTGGEEVLRSLKQYAEDPVRSSP